MTTKRLKTGVQPTPETSCISIIRQTMDNVQHSAPIMNHHPLSQTFRAKCPLRLVVYNNSRDLFYVK
jgi:hypothetical protein